jgi:hypothetical protein
MKLFDLLLVVCSIWTADDMHVVCMIALGLNMVAPACLSAFSRPHCKQQHTIFRTIWYLLFVHVCAFGCLYGSELEACMTMSMAANNVAAIICGRGSCCCFAWRKLLRDAAR